MANLTIAGTTWYPLASFRNVKNYYQYVPLIDGENRAMQDLTAEATDGIEKVDHGFRGRMFGPISLVIVQSSYQALLTEYALFRADIEGQPNGVTINGLGGETYNNCYLVSGFPKPAQGDWPRKEESGNWYQLLYVQFKQERE